MRDSSSRCSDSRPAPIEYPMCIIMCMRTNIDLDDDLVRQAQKLTGISTKKGVVHEALRVLVEVRRRRDLAELEGEIRFAEGYDYKARRAR